MLFVFLFHNQYHYPQDYNHQSPLQVYNHENKYQFHILKLCNEFVYPSNEFFIESSVVFSVTFIMSYSLKPKPVLKFSLSFSFSNLFTPSLHCFNPLQLFIILSIRLLRTYLILVSSVSYLVNSCSVLIYFIFFCSVGYLVSYIPCICFLTRLEIFF